MPRSVVLLSPFFTVLLAAPTQAALVRYQVAGTVVSVSDELTSEFSAGEPVRAQLRIESIPTHMNADEPIYSVPHFKMVIGDDYTITSNSGSLSIHNDIGGQFDIMDYITGTFTAPEVDGHELSSVLYRLVFNADELNSTNLPPQFALPTFIDISNLTFDHDDSLTVELRLHDFSVVPEPASFLLALFSLGIVSRRLRRKVSQG